MTPLADYRKKMNISQGELARKLGIPQSTLCAYERGLRFPDFGRAKLIEGVTGIPAESLLNPERLSALQSYLPAPSEEVPA